MFVFLGLIIELQKSFNLNKIKKPSLLEKVFIL
jgi:hypothetical protein